MGFYEKLGVPPKATREEIREGYNRMLGQLVRKLRRAREVGADVAALSAQRDELQEAFDVLSDPRRRRLYDGYLVLESAESLPADLDSFWNRVRDSAADPAAAAAVELIRALTSLPVGDSMDPAAAVPPRKVELKPALSMIPPEERPLPQLSPEPAPPEPRPEIRLPDTLRPLETPGNAVSIDLGALSAEPPDRGAPAAPAAPEDPVLDLARLSETYGYDGRYLAAVRRSKGVSLDHLAAETQIALRYLEAIEINDFARLPAAVFVRGYLRELAEVMEIADSDELIEGYMTRYARYRGE